MDLQAHLLDERVLLAAQPAELLFQPLSLRARHFQLLIQSLLQARQVLVGYTESKSSRAEDLHCMQH
jgi:hypothetical protein